MNPFNSTRRRMLAGALGASALSPLSTLSFASSGSGVGDRRFVFVILRGGLDGLSAVPAVGDPEFAGARGALAQFGTAPLALDSGFALHPNLAQLHAMATANCSTTKARPRTSPPGARPSRRSKARATPRSNPRA